MFPEKANGRMVVAERLISAKGRFERKWFAEKGGLWLALSIYDEFSEDLKGLLLLGLGLAVVRCVHEFGVISARIKWINDIHINGKKLAGILVERISEKEENWILIGIGINVNNKLPQHLPAISLKEILKKEVPLKEVLFKLVKWLRFYAGFLRYYEKKKLEEEGVKNLLLEDYKLFCDTIGRCVCYSYNFDKEDFLVGKCLNIGAKGELLLKTEKGVFKFSTGEVLYVY